MENTQNKGRRGMDMLHGSIADKLFLFAMPIGLMGLFEQLFNSADVVILGRFVGKSAMLPSATICLSSASWSCFSWGFPWGLMSPLPSISVPAATIKWNGRSRRLF